MSEITPVPFTGFPKMGRLTRECVITEKIDGTNAQIYITQDGQFLTGSRTRWITPGDDNFGFAKWAHEHKDELMALGPGQHFGEWWGAGIQRKYGLKEKRFSLFNVSRWHLAGQTPGVRAQAWDPVTKAFKSTPTEPLPPCCSLVPTLYSGIFSTTIADNMILKLQHEGSQAAPGFMDPEGIVIYHVALGAMFKKTVKNDESPKSLA